MEIMFGNDIHDNSWQKKGNTWRKKISTGKLLKKYN